MKKKSHSLRNTDAQLGAFSLIELLLAIGLISILTIVSLPLYFSYYERSSLDVATRTVAHSWRRAEDYSRALRGDSGWGVAVGSSSAIVFKGNDFAGRDQAWDELSSWPTDVYASGSVELSFETVTGHPLAPALLVLSSVNDNASSTISADSNGLITY